MTNNFILIKKNNGLEYDLLNELLRSLFKSFNTSELDDYYLIKTSDYDINSIIISLNSFIGDFNMPLRAYVDTYSDENDLNRIISIVTKYFSKAIKYNIYTSKELFYEFINESKEDFKLLLFKNYSNDYDTLNILKVFIENNMNVLKSSKELFVHRNTLINKLDRFYFVTGLDPKEFKDAYLIYTIIK